MINADSHTHCDFSHDSRAKMEDMVKKAAELGLKQIAFTDHIDYVPSGERLYYPIDYTEYIKVFNKLKEQYSDTVELIFGIEVGLEPQLKPLVTEFVKSYPFEYVIGSSHNSEMKEHFTGEFFEGKDKKTAHSVYLSEVLENVKTIDCFDCYGHIDYISRYGPYPDRSLRYEDYKELIDEILKQIVARGKGIEINTSGFRYDHNSAYPSLEILKAYKRLGGEIITVGSDAHIPEHIKWCFDDAEAALLEAGFTHYTVFKNKKPEWVKI